MSLVYLQQGNVKKSKKLMKLANIDEENLHIFQTTLGISMKFSGKMCLMIILKVKKAGLYSLSRKYIFKKTTRRQRTPPPAFSGLNHHDFSRRIEVN